MARRTTSRIPTKIRHSLSIAEARRIALAAQGFGGARRSSPGLDDILATIRALGVVQMDSVNVLVRSHYLPLFSRLGSYSRELLDRAVYESPRSLFEYWGHEASLLPIELYPAFRWRMENARADVGTWKHVSEYARDHRPELDRLLVQLREGGPATAGALNVDTAKRRRGASDWWQRSSTKVGLEALFWMGEVATRQRRHFERIYDLPERIIPAKVRKQTLTPEQAQRTLLNIAARAMGVATESDLRDYYRLPLLETRAALNSLCESAELRRVAVEGWDAPAYLHRDAACPEQIAASTLLSPFDSLIWERSRAQRLFDFRFRLEIYTPSHKRVHGYYVLPFLLNERIVARLDLKADRAANTLRVIAAHREDHGQPAEITAPLCEEIQRLAHWLELKRIAFGRRGTLSKSLRAEMTARSYLPAPASRRRRVTQRSE